MTTNTPTIWPTDQISEATSPQLAYAEVARLTAAWSKDTVLAGPRVILVGAVYLAFWVIHANYNFGRMCQCLPKFFHYVLKLRKSFEHCILLQILP